MKEVYCSYTFLLFSILYINERKHCTVSTLSGHRAFIVIIKLLCLCFILYEEFGTPHVDVFNRPDSEMHNLGVRSL